jgi:acetolactate decarboxylase
VVQFEPTIDFDLSRPMTQKELLIEVDSRIPPDTVAFALRVDGDFELVKARSVPRQEPPYRPLADVIADQHVFELRDLEGTLVGFRFPDYAQGIEAAGYHLHFISVDRTRGGHVLDFEARSGRVRVDTSADLHVELPAGIELAAPDLSAATHDALERVERSG